MEPFLALLTSNLASSMAPVVTEWFGRRRSPQQLEQLIIELLDLEVTSRGGSLLRETTGPFDARMDAGFRHLPGPTAVDVWMTSRLGLPDWDELVSGLFVSLIPLTDPNLRRLLEYATLGQDEPRHFVFMRRASVPDLQGAALVDEGPPVSHEAAEDFLKVHHTLQERVLRELGLRVIWFDSYEHMPPAVRSLRA